MTLKGIDVIACDISSETEEETQDQLAAQEAQALRAGDFLGMGSPLA